MAKTFYITTAIDYTNSAPHIGHAYEKVLADVIARYHRLKGENVFFLTGVDQHGQKVQQSAAKAGVPPAEFVKGVTQKFVDLWKKLDVKYDAWAETIDPRHKKVVQGMLQRLFDEKQIYKDKQAGYYSIRQEQFLTDKERGPDGQFGPEWGQVEFREEENYYFKLSQHKDWLLGYIDNRKDAVIPDFRQTELRNAIGRISGDLCISRPKSRLHWGIGLPFDKDFVTYVWFDALTNYISFAGYDPNASAVATGLRPVVTDRSSESVRTAHRTVATTDFDVQPQEFRDKWPALQIIGKDILVPAHGIYWLIMLHAIGFPDKQMPQLLVFFFQAEGGIRDVAVTGVQTCALPICDNGQVLAVAELVGLAEREGAIFFVHNGHIGPAQPQVGGRLDRAQGRHRLVCGGFIGGAKREKVVWGKKGESRGRRLILKKKQK